MSILDNDLAQDRSQFVAEAAMLHELAEHAHQRRAKPDVQLAAGRPEKNGSQSEPFYRVTLQRNNVGRVGGFLFHSRKAAASVAVDVPNNTVSPRWATHSRDGHFFALVTSNGPNAQKNFGSMDRVWEFFRHASCEFGFGISKILRKKRSEESKPPRSTTSSRPAISRIGFS
jgi:hypothetical protein